LSFLSEIATPQEYAGVAWVYRNAAVHDLGWAFEQLFRNDGGVSTPADIQHFGKLIGETQRSRVSEERQGKQLGKLGVAAAMFFGVRGSNDKHPDKPMVDTIFELSARLEHRRQGYHTRESEENRAFSDTIGVVTLMLALGVTPSEIAENPQMTAEIVHKVTMDCGRPVSVWDARGILREIDGWNGSVLDWVSLEVVGRMVETLRGKPIWSLMALLCEHCGSPLVALHSYAYRLPPPDAATDAGKARTVN
jgi:hypothetical protein